MPHEYVFDLCKYFHFILYMFVLLCLNCNIICLYYQLSNQQEWIKNIKRCRFCRFFLWRRASKYVFLSSQHFFPYSIPCIWQDLAVCYVFCLLENLINSQEQLFSETVLNMRKCSFCSFRTCTSFKMIAWIHSLCFYKNEKPGNRSRIVITSVSYVSCIYQLYVHFNIGNRGGYILKMTSSKGMVIVGKLQGNICLCEFKLNS